VVDAVSNTRADRAAALGQWVDRVTSDELVPAYMDALRVIADLADQSENIDAAIVEAVQSARAAHRSWSEIGAMLGVSKQAGQRKYSKVVST
jgi:hypothetical protein